MRVVSNTSPLSNFAVIGKIALLQQIYPKIVIPPAVYDELMRLREIQPMVTSSVSAGWLEIQTPTNFQLIQILQQTLDHGESEAIALALQLKVDRLLIDERLGRSIATQYGLSIRGILGILINAKDQGLIPALKPLLDQLIIQAGFRVERTLYEYSLREVGE
ncbi:MAG: DUF3368 domain-containing protein [Tildeniella nuda ZEHNDER 1965/U140]|jgi:hypothetical protein|nr:DUF3368 domain-containing protein [Tildeniella nuda ZEHNDER 1965/U140]